MNMKVKESELKIYYDFTFYIEIQRFILFYNYFNLLLCISILKVFLINFFRLLVEY